jgi:hypothetical protein
VTGGPAFRADIGAVFEGADVTLLLATAGVVAALLLLTYRSPFLWLVPLVVVGVGDRVAAILVGALAGAVDLDVDASAAASSRCSSSAPGPTTRCCSSPATATSCASARTASPPWTGPCAPPRRRSSRAAAPSR